jgi:hypothetical protein
VSGGGGGVGAETAGGGVGAVTGGGIGEPGGDAATPVRCALNFVDSRPTSYIAEYIYIYLKK